jgi:Cof subfamily protein (haloacid dehalogenase superfamily)
MIKLIAIDLDGTLLNPDGSISRKSHIALKEAKNKGVKIVLCSGRPLAGIKPFLKELGLTDPGDYAITYNGGLVQKTDTGDVLSERILTRHDIISLYALSRKIGVPMNFIDMNKVYCPDPPADRPSLYRQIMHALPFVKADIEQLPSDLKINKVVYCTDQAALDQAIRSIPAFYRSQYTMMKSRTILLEILNKDVNKARGLQVLGSYLKIAPREMMAIGDQENDLAMIRYAGLGVAMGNAIMELKNDAQFVTKTNNEDGVAFAVEKFVLS